LCPPLGSVLLSIVFFFSLIPSPLSFPSVPL
jgi:hypothetical protein